MMAPTDFWNSPSIPFPSTIMDAPQWPSSKACHLKTNWKGHDRANQSLKLPNDA